ncbi:MAG: hypothetical protein V4569_18180 [Pseudomonadota bacterium]
MTRKSWVLALCAAAALVGCGGGGDEGPPPATESVPPSASASAAGFIGYLKRLVVASADTLEPVDVSGVTPPTDDAADPVAVD